MRNRSAVRTKNTKRGAMVSIAALATVMLAGAGMQALADPEEPIRSPAPTSPASPMQVNLTTQELKIARTVAVEAASGAKDVRVVAAKTTLEDYFQAYSPDVQGLARENATTTDVLLVAVAGEAPNVVRRVPAGAPAFVVIGQIIVVDLDGQTLSRTLVQRDPEADGGRGGADDSTIDLSLSEFDPILIELQ